MEELGIKGKMGKNIKKELRRKKKPEEKALKGNPEVKNWRKRMNPEEKEKTWRKATEEKGILKKKSWRKERPEEKTWRNPQEESIYKKLSLSVPVFG